MKRWLLSIPLLLGGILGLAHADYVILIANVGGYKAPADPMRPGSGPMGPMGPMGPGPMPMPGMGPGPRPGPGMPYGDQNQDTEAEPRLIIATLEFENAPSILDIQKFLNGDFLMVQHHWGGFTPLLAEGKIIQSADALATLPVGANLFIVSTDKAPQGKLFPGVGKRYAARYAETYKSKPEADRVLELAEWALQHGLTKKFEEVMDKLAAEDKSKDAVVRYLKIKERLKADLPDEPAAGWRADFLKNASFTAVKSPHYTLYHNLQTNDGDMIKSRLDRLEDAFHVYYYWWALKGPDTAEAQVHLPPHRLMVILDGQEDEFRTRHEAFTYKRQPGVLGADVKEEVRHLHAAYSSGPLVADGFVSRREDVAVLCVKRTDVNYDALDKFSAPLFDSPDARRKLLHLKAEKPKAFEVSTKASLALLLRIMEEDGERAGISHNASRQLAFSSGLLPRNVTAPEWIQFGLGSFFETPLGAPWASPTDVSSLHYPAFMETAREINKEKATAREQHYELLRSVVTDSAFRQTANEPNKPLALRKARANAWALTFYLANRDRDGLLRYSKELAKMPRDRELDDEMLLGCFARAFNAWDPRKNAVDMEKMHRLADSWFSVLYEKQLESAELMTSVQSVREQVEKALSGPPNPMGPGPMGMGGLGGIGPRP